MPTPAATVERSGTRYLDWIVYTRLDVVVAAFLTLSDAVNFGRTQGDGAYLYCEGRRAPDGFDFATIHEWQYGLLEEGAA